VQQEVETLPSYRGQIVGVDAAALGLVVVGAAGGNGAAGLGALTYVFGGPIVHLAHGNGERAGQSLAMRVGLPLIAGYIGYKMEPECRGDVCGEDQVVGMLAGGLIGIVTASVLDATYLGASERRVKTRAWTPTLGSNARGTWSLGIAGNF
jgi:hypothetical protein